VKGSGTHVTRIPFVERERYGEMALYVKEKMSTTYAVLGLNYSGRACDGCKKKFQIARLRPHKRRATVLAQINEWRFYP
jgi:hypothetical protein